MSKLPVADYIKQIRKKIARNEKNYDNIVDTILEENGVKVYPINAFDIAKKMGFDIKYARFKNSSISGALWDGVDEMSFGDETFKRVIFVNGKESPRRQLFTVAHEIGHFILHCNDESNFYERYMTDKKDNVEPNQKKMEDDADYFAASLLLPRNILVQYIRINGLNDNKEIIDKVSSDFFVEKETISKRLYEIGYKF